jgi:hypothetical protein
LDKIAVSSVVCALSGVASLILFAAIYVRVWQLKKAPGSFVEYVDAPDKPPILMPTEAWFLYFSRPCDLTLWRLLLGFRMLALVFLFGVLFAGLG